MRKGAEYAKETYNRKSDDLFLFRNGVQPYLNFEPRLNNVFTILFNATWIERKGISTLIGAAKILFEKGLKLKYQLIGTGKDVNTVAADWPEELRPLVSVVPKFDQDEEKQYLENCDIFVLPSFSEGQPLSLLQAMAAGRCCITTNCCGQKDVITHGKTGFLFEVGDHQELALQIYLCYQNREMAAEVGARAREYIEHFSWKKVSQDVSEFIIDNS